MLPVLMVIACFIVGMRTERARALAVAAVVGVAGAGLVVVMSAVDDTDFLDSASGWVQLAAGITACFVAALVGSAVRDRRSATRA